MKKHPNIKSRAGLWIMVVAAVVLEATACIQYFYSRATIRHEAEMRAKSELRCAELEINVVTSQVEMAVQNLALLAQHYLDKPDSMYSAVRLFTARTPDITSACVAFKPYYYPSKGKWFEPCASEMITRDKSQIYTRQIGGEDHDYFQYEWYRNGITIDSCWWCEPYYDNAGSMTMIVSCSYPILDASGKVVGVALADVSLEHLKHISRYLQVYKESYYSISSSTGVDIVPPPDTIPGRKYLIYDEEIDSTGWKLAIIIPEDVLFADLKHVGLIVTILMWLGLALLLFIMYHSAQNLFALINVNNQKERMESELEVAKTIQNAMLPKVFPPFADRPDINVYGMVNPAKEIGGDLYDFYVRHEKLFFCVGDVSGKGVPAALVMATTRSLFRSVTAHEERPEVIVSEMNNSLAEANDQNMFITLFVGVLNLKTGDLQYCNAGHNAPMILNANTDGQHQQTIGFIDVLPNLPIGILADYPYRAQHTKIAYNDLLFLYTDGLTEAENGAHEQFGEERMKAALEQVCDRQPQEIVDGLKAEVAAFVGEAPQSDDLTMLTIRYQQPAIFMRNDIQQIPTLAEWVEWLGLPDELNMPVNLALEEVVSNVMLYAYPQETSGTVTVEAWRNNGNLCFAITDSGKPFDPTQQNEADISLSAEEREIGGLGIHLVRKLMDELHYRRVDGKNVLTLKKKL